MWQIDGEKVTCGTKGGLVSGWKQSMKSVSNNEWREVFSNKIIAGLGYTSMLDYYLIVYEN